VTGRAAARGVETTHAEVVADIEPLSAEWDELALRGGSHPFLRPGWIGAWWEAFGTGALRIVTLRRDGRLVAALPLSEQGSTLRGVANAHSPWFGPVAEEPELGTELARAVVGMGPSTVHLDQLRADDPATRALLGGLRAAGYRFLERSERSPSLPMDGTWEDYQARLGSGRRQSIRRRLRKLEAIGQPVLEVASGPWSSEALDAELAAGFAIEARGWKGRRGTAVVAQHDTARFYRSMAAWAASEGILRLMSLRAGSVRLTFSLDLEADGRHYGLKLGVDPEHRAVGPGILHTYLVIERCFADQLTSFEMLGWDEPWKRSFGPEFRPRSHVVAIRPGAVGRLRWMGNRAVRGARRRVGVVVGRSRGTDAQA
jgi:CelD/BcsL family acetyltransferase involved in cellulose biosynthesis